MSGGSPFAPGVRVAVGVYPDRYREAFVARVYRNGLFTLTQDESKTRWIWAPYYRSDGEELWTARMVASPAPTMSCALMIWTPETDPIIRRRIAEFARMFRGSRSRA